MKFRCVTRPSFRRGHLWKPSILWANDICNAKFDWFSRKETKSTYDKRPFSTREARWKCEKKFVQKSQNQESWIFAGFISQQNASKKRLGLCSIPGSTSGSRSRAWTLSKMILFHAHFWTSKFAWNRIKETIIAKDQKWRARARARARARVFFQDKCGCREVR